MRARASSLHAQEPPGEQPSAILEAAGCGWSGSGLGAGRGVLRALGGDAVLRRGKLGRGRRPALARP